MMSTASSKTFSTPSHRRCHHGRSRRPAHSRTVVASTVPQDGSRAGGRLGGDGRRWLERGASLACPGSSGCLIGSRCQPQLLPLDGTSGQRTSAPSHSRQLGVQKPPVPIRPRPWQ